jgi:hypothetical protein
MPSTSTSVQIEQADEENYYQKYEYKAYYQSASSNPFPTYDDPIYQPYIPTEYSYEQESVDQYEPVIPEYVPKPITKAPQPAITTKVSIYFLIFKFKNYNFRENTTHIPFLMTNHQFQPIWGMTKFCWDSVKHTNKRHRLFQNRSQFRRKLSSDRLR